MLTDTRNRIFSTVYCIINHSPNARVPGDNLCIVTSGGWPISTKKRAKWIWFMIVHLLNACGCTDHFPASLLFLHVGLVSYDIFWFSSSTNCFYCVCSNNNGKNLIALINKISFHFILLQKVYSRYILVYTVYIHGIYLQSGGKHITPLPLLNYIQLIMTNSLNVHQYSQEDVYVDTILPQVQL